jgi:predicted nucleotidyltransferase component of viral defense system
MSKFLTDFQKKILKEVGKGELSKSFFWSGGTALSYCYLEHRESFDLDFMSTDLFPDEFILGEINKISNNLEIKKIEEQKIYNRHNFWLKKNKETLKLEFVFYPFPSIKKPKRLEEFNIKIDSIEDILTNKMHSIFERSEPKDVFDFYCILKKERINFNLVFNWVKKKFGVEIDPVLFTGKVLEGADKLNEIRPLIIKKEFYNLDKIKKYFEQRVQKYLKKKIH